MFLRLPAADVQVLLTNNQLVNFRFFQQEKNPRREPLPNHLWLLTSQHKVVGLHIACAGRCRRSRAQQGISTANASTALQQQQHFSAGDSNCGPHYCLLLAGHSSTPFQWSTKNM
jgi:hypothetical protein